MSQKRILQHGPLAPPLEARLRDEFAVERLPDGDARAAFLAARGAEFEGLVTSGGFGADAALLDALPSLQVISSFGVGIDRVDLHAAAARGVAVGHTPDVLNDCVADLAFGLLIDVARGLSACDRFVRRSDWVRSKMPLATRVSGKRLGIVGMGRIGRAIALRSVGFDMAVRYHSRSPVAETDYRHEPSLVELARWCDFLIVIVPGGPATQHLISAEVIDALGPQGFLINIARGSVVDEDALVRALRERRIAGAGLDVYADEPNVPAALFELDNVVLLPHVGSATHETREAMAELTFHNLQSWFAEGRLVAAAPLPVLEQR